MRTLVPAVRTHLSLDEAVAAMADAFSEFMKRDPTPRQLAILVAQSALETGHWASMWNFNWGNVKMPSTADGDYCQFRCNEIIGGKVVWFDPPHPQTSFRAYASAADGAIEQVKFLAERPRYAEAWRRCISGDSAGFVRALASAGYFTANVDAYERAVVSLTASIEPVCRRILASEHHGLDEVEQERIRGLVALTLSEGGQGRYAEHDTDPAELAPESVS